MDPLTVASGGDLYVGAMVGPGNFYICFKYSAEYSGLRDWEEIDNCTDIEYDCPVGDSDLAQPNMIELDGYIYVIGGKYVESACEVINKYEIADDCWVECCDLKAGVAECNLAIMDKKVLILDTECYEKGEEPGAFIQMYDPAKNESFIVLDDAGLKQDGLKEDIRLTVESGLCYVICDPVQDVMDVDNDGAPSSQTEQNPRVFEQNPRVFKLVCNLDSDPPSVAVGEEIPQSHPHRNNYIRAFCIDDKTFVNVNGCVHKIKDGIATEGDLNKWRNITKTRYRPVHFTYDIRKLLGTADEKVKE